jgi:ketosteroid isomerase-like protein
MRILPAVLLVCALPAAGCGPSDDEQAIRQHRESSNAAIAKHDTAGVGAILADDLVVVTSNSVHSIGRQAMLDRFVDQFHAHPDVVYERRPTAVDVFSDWGMASEFGVWTGSWTDTDGRISLVGTYFAKWRLVGGAWRVESETYVPKSCSGGAYCQTPPR